MTILPKKKEQKKNDGEEGESRNRTVRNRSSRTDVRRIVQEESETSQSLDNRVNLEVVNIPPQKRSRHRQAASYFPNNNRDRDTPSPKSENNEEDGYNSSDEYEGKSSIAEDSKDIIHNKSEPTAEQELEFEQQLLEVKGFQIKQMATDGACMFRAVADQIYGDQEMHTIVRNHCMDYIAQNRDFFSQYITEDFHAYIRRKRHERSHGNNVEMQALSEIYSRPIEVYQYSCEPINTFHSRQPINDENPPIRLSYHGSIHYNSVIDPYNPTVGVGLGLAGYKPLLHNQQLLQNTIQESEAQQLEQEMLQDKLKATDWEATDDHLTEIAARESYLEWLQNRSSKGKEKSTGASTSTSTSSQSRPSPRRSPPRCPENKKRTPPRCEPRTTPPRDAKKSLPHDKNSPLRHVPSSAAGVTKSDCADKNSAECSTISDTWTYTLGYSEEWDNDPVLAAVLAQSQQEYLHELTQRNSQNNSGGHTSHNNNRNNSNSSSDNPGRSGLS